MRSRSDLLAHAIAGLVILVAVAILSIEFAGNPDLVKAGARDPGPGFLPRMVLILLGLCALWMTVTSVWGFARTARDEGTAGAGGARAELRRMLVPALMIAALAAVVWLAPGLGFLPVAIVFTVGWALVIAWQDRATGTKAGYVVAGVGALVFTVAVYALFDRVIGVPL